MEATSGEIQAPDAQNERLQKHPGTAELDLELSGNGAE